MAKKEFTLEEALAKIEEQKYLADAVEAKDKEIIDLKNKTQEIIAEYTERFNQLKLKSQEETALKVQKNTEELTEKIKVLSEENKRLVNLFGKYIDITRNTLKGFQGQLDNAIELETLLTEKITGKGKE